MSEPGWEQADPAFPYLEEPPVVAVQAGLAAAQSSVIPESADPGNHDSED
jgi:hypothetical protein